MQKRYSYTIASLLLLGFLSVVPARGQGVPQMDCQGPVCDAYVTNSVVLSTGIDPITNTPLTGNVDPLWNLILYPPTPISPSNTSAGPAKLLSTSGFWFPYYNLPLPNNSLQAKYITANFGPAGSKPNSVGNPYRFQRCFCICESTTLTFDLTLLADDIAEVSLLSPDGSTQLLGGIPQASAFTQRNDIDAMVTVTDPGRYCLNVDVRDKGAVVMGFALEGTVSGTSLLNPNENCCPILSTISGTKFQDNNCNGQFEDNVDANLSNWAIELVNASNGNIINTVSTDQYGNYSFGSLYPGNYIIREQMQAGWQLSNPADNQYLVNITSVGQVFAGRNFFNCPSSDPPCNDCPTSFAPIPGERYVLSAWVKENTGPGAITYNGPEVWLKYTDINITDGPYKGQGRIIDGWQRIEAAFTIPNDATKIEIVLNNSGTNESFFDDIRFFPFNANLKSFVYDPVSLRLWAELDQNNFATFYEYDEEGALIRVKKETERGIQTIQESRNASKKQ